MITYKEVLGMVKRADALNDIYRGSDDWMLHNGYMQALKPSGSNPYATTNSPYAVIPTGPSQRAQQIARRNQQAMKAYRRGSRRTYVPSIASSGRRTSRYV